MNCLKVEKSKAERTRKKLIRTGFLDHDFQVFPEGEYVYFPIKPDCPDDFGEIVEHDAKLKTKKPKSLREALDGKLTYEKMRDIPSSYTVIGDIAIVEIGNSLKDEAALIGEALISTFPSIKSVFEKVGQVDGSFRVPTLRHIAGVDRTMTIHRENQMRLKVDVAKTYFNPRTGSERMRVAQQIAPGERVLVFFAGVGPYAIACAKHGAHVTAVEINPEAVDLMRINAKLNKVDIEIHLGDVSKVIPELGKFDRIIMPLPKQAKAYLDVASSALASGGTINFYCFAKNSLEATGSIAEDISGLGKRMNLENVLVCGTYSPCLQKFALDFTLEDI